MVSSELASQARYPQAQSSPGPRWAARDWIAAAAMFLATAAVVLWQNAHVAILFDFSYILDVANRIALGQAPYRDFPLAHTPLTFAVQAAVIRLTGRVIFHHQLYCAVTGGLGTVLAWRTALALLRGRIAAAWIVALLLAAPLVFLGVYSIVPYPEYDCDCGFWLLCALWMFVALDRRKGALFAFAAGAVAVVPTLFKQNMGLPFLLAAVCAVLFLGGMFRAKAKSVHGAFLLGAFAGVAAALVVLGATAGLGNYLHWTIQYAGQRRMPGLGLMLSVYHDATMAWTLPCVGAGLLLLRSKTGRRLWARLAALVLLAVPFLAALASLWLYEDADERGDALLSLWPLLLVLAGALALVELVKLRDRGVGEPALRLVVPLILLAAIHGTFMSQQLWGSTYGIWPLLILLIAELLAWLARIAPNRLIPVALAGLISVTLTVCGGFYTASEERLSYAKLPDEAPEHSVFPALQGLATPGPYLLETDEMLRYAQANIPVNDGIVLMPGEEPFYFATGRTPHFPLPFFDPTIDPYSPAEIAAMVRERNIRWLIVKTDIQTKEDPTPDRPELMRLLMPLFRPAAHLRGYDVYRR